MEAHVVVFWTVCICTIWWRVWSHCDTIRPIKQSFILWPSAYCYFSESVLDVPFIFSSWCTDSQVARQIP
jgi:hypothetical protein